MDYSTGGPVGNHCLTGPLDYSRMVAILRGSGILHFMFKYTANPSILQDMEVPKTGRYWDKEFFKRKEILKSYGLPEDYNLTVVLKVDYPDTVYYSPERLDYIPVHGYLFPSSMFVEEKV